MERMLEDGRREKNILVWINDGGGSDSRRSFVSLESWRIRTAPITPKTILTKVGMNDMYNV